MAMQSYHGTVFFFGMRWLSRRRRWRLLPSAKPDLLLVSQCTPGPILRFFVPVPRANPWNDTRKTLAGRREPKAEGPVCLSHSGTAEKVGTREPNQVSAVKQIQRYWNNRK